MFFFLFRLRRFASSSSSPRREHNSTSFLCIDEAEALRRGEVVASRSLENLEKSFFCSPLATPLLFRFKKTQNDNSAAKAKPAHKAGKGGKADEAGEALKVVKVSSSSA